MQKLTYTLNYKKIYMTTVTYNVRSLSQTIDKSMLFINRLNHVIYVFSY